jgi:hypothetical protein
VGLLVLVGARVPRAAPLPCLLLVTRLQPGNALLVTPYPEAPASCLCARGEFIKFIFGTAASPVPSLR